MAKDNTSTSAEQDFGAQFIRNRKRRRTRRILALLVVVAGAGGYYYWTTTQVTDASTDETLIVEIGYGDIENAIPATGSLQPKEVVPVGARASGELVEILVEEGDLVEEDQILARIDAEEQELRVQQSTLNIENQRNQVAQRELQLENAQKDLARTEMLYAAGASTEQELENARNNLLNAQTQLDNLLNSIQQSESSLAQERVQLNYTEIRAPLTGTVISLDQKEGATLNASQTAPTVMQIADLSTMTVEVEISEADIGAVGVGMDVYFTTLGGGERRWDGNLQQILPMGTVSNNVVLFTGRFDVDNSDGELYPNMTTQVFFVTSEARDVLTVPLGALTFLDEGSAEGGRPANGQAPSSEQMSQMRERFQQNGGEITPEMRQQFERMRQNGGFPGGDFPGFGDGQSGGPAGASLAGSIALNEPRNATVQLVQPDGSTVTREVVIGTMDRANAEVISGLEAGDRVVAGIVQERLEDDDDDDNNGGWNRGRSRGFGF